MGQLWRIFKIFFKIGSLSFGGGYTMVLVIQREVVERYKLVHMMEFMSMLALAQSAPGPLVVNTAIMVGHKLKGIRGSIVAAIGAILPSFLVMLTIAIIFGVVADNEYLRRFFMGVRPAVSALILTSVILFARRLKVWSYTVVLATAAAIYYGISPLIVIATAILLGIIYTFTKVERFKRNNRVRKEGNIR